MDQYELLVEADDRVIRFRLVGSDGVQLAANQIAIEKHSPADWEGVFDIGTYVRRYAGNLARGGRTATAADLIDDVGSFLGEKVLGDAIVSKLQGTKRRMLVVVLPDPGSSPLAAAFARVPWELARTSAHPKPLLNQALVIHQRLRDIAPATLDDAGSENVRVLLVFAEAPGSRPLAMRHEREQILDLFFTDILPKANVEVDVLCHGVTRERLEEQIRSRGGYHIIHWSGHGHHNLLEMYPEPITSRELVELFVSAGGFVPNLMFLSACQSATVVEVKDWTAFHAAMSDAKPADAAAAQTGYTGTAIELLRAGVPQVIAMRNEVSDDYARELARQFYKHLLADTARHSSDAALALARGELLRDPKLGPSFHPIDHVTPVIAGHLLPPLAPERKRSPQHASRWPRPQPLLPGGSRELDRPSVFVGRSVELTRMAAEWLRDGAPGVAVIQGLAGLGKTALAAEAIQLWHTRFDFVMAFQAKPQAIPIDDFYRDLDMRLTLESAAYRERGDRSPYSRIFFPAEPALTGQARLERLRNNLIDVLREERILLVLDNFETHLESIQGPDGYRTSDPEWDLLLSELAQRLPETDSRLLVTTRHRPSALADTQTTLWLPLGPLPMLEAVLYLRSHPALRTLYFGDDGGRALVMRLLRISRGHPLILDRLASLAEDSVALLQALDELEKRGGWEKLPDLFAIAKSAADREAERAYLEDVAIGAIDLLIQRATPDARQLLWILTLAGEPVTVELLECVWWGMSIVEHRMKVLLQRLPTLPPAQQREVEALLDDEDAKEIRAQLAQRQTPEIMPLLAELSKAGLVSHVFDQRESLLAFTFHELVRERVGAWMTAHPEERAGRTDESIWTAYGQHYRDIFAWLAQSPDAPKETATEAGRNAIAYLIRAGEYGLVSDFAVNVIIGTNDPQTLRSIVDLLRSVADRIPAGRMRWRFRASLADALSKAEQPDEALPHYATAAAEAEAADSSDLGMICQNWAAAFSKLGALDQARETYLKSAEIKRKSGAPEVLIVGSELEALRIDVMRGDASAALPEIESRVDKIRAWWKLNVADQPVPEAPDRPFLVGAYVGALDIAWDANASLKQWEKVLDLGREMETVRRESGQSELDLATTRFNLYSPLLALGRIGEARRSIEESLAVFLKENHVSLQASALSALSEIWRLSGDYDRAIALARQSLSLRNRLPAPHERGTSHLRLAYHLLGVGESDESAAHLLAAGAYRLATGRNVDGWLQSAGTLAMDAKARGVTYRLPQLSELLPRAEFAPLAAFLQWSRTDIAALQAFLNEVVRALDEAGPEIVREDVDARRPPDDRPPDEVVLPDIETRGGDAAPAPSDAIGVQEPGTRLYTVWYGTNRKPIDAAKPELGFTGQRDVAKIHYGACRVAIPQSHKFGSVGSAWWKRLLTLNDDCIRLREIRPSSETEFWDAIREELSAWPEDEQQALVYLHGYNVTFEEAAVRAAQIGFDLKVQGATAFFSWPSQGSIEGYPVDAASIDASEAAITTFLVEFTQRVGAHRVHVIAHSMGNRGLLRAMQRIHANAQQRSLVRFGQIFLAAPDVDADLFCDLAKLYPDLCRRTTLYVSPSDRAVGLSQWLYGAPRAGFTPPVTVVDGIDTIEIPDFDLDLLGHSYYAEAAGVLHDMFDLLRRNAAPDGRQRLQVVRAEGAGPYWTMSS